MKVEIRHIKTNTTLGYSAVYFVRLSNGTTKEFGIDYKAAKAFVRAEA